MANTAQAKKRARQAEKRRQHNVALRSKVRSSIKKVVTALGSGGKDQAQTAYQASIPIIDSMARKGLISKNKAARHKSRLNARLRAL
ncbi:MAG: 30S ribosomal protein S20 [Pseudomonadota bacterium]